MLGRSQFAAVKQDVDGLMVPTLVNSLKSAVQNAEALVSREEKLKTEIEGKKREIQLLQENLSEKSRSEKEVRELASRLMEERDGLSARLKENEAVKKENIELKRKICDLECAKLRLETDVDVYRSRFKELEGRVLNLEKDYEMLSKAENSREPVDMEIENDGVGNLPTETTNAGERKVSEVLSETNANPTGGSSHRKRTGNSKPSKSKDIVVIIDSDVECASHESASEVDKAHSGQNVAENEPGAHKRKLTSFTEQSGKSAGLGNKSPDVDDNFQTGKAKRAKVEEHTPFIHLGERDSRTTLNSETSRKGVIPPNLFNDSPSSSSDNEADLYADFSTFRTEDFVYTTPKRKSS